MTGGLSASAGMRLRGLLLAQGRLRRFESNSPAVGVRTRVTRGIRKAAISPGVQYPRDTEKMR